MYNKCIMIGNLTRDPEIKAVGESHVCKFTIAMNHRTKDKEEVCFVDIVTWGKQAELVAKFFSKGKPILVEGRLKQDSWEKDGKQFTKHVINAEKVSFIGGKTNDDAPQAPMMNEPKRIYPSDRNALENQRYAPSNGQKNLESNNLDMDELPF